MPQIGDIENSRNIGRKGNYKLVWQACIDCGKERWIRCGDKSKRCFNCNEHLPKPHIRRDKNYRWQGGRWKSDGYIYVMIEPDSPYYLMTVPSKNINSSYRRSYVAEHRLVMAQYIGRCLSSIEYVHHKNADRSDNRIENLELVTIRTHKLGYQEGYKQGFLDGVASVKKE